MSALVTVPTYVAAQVRAAEKPLLDAGVPLMDHAANALATIVRRMLPASGGSVLVLAGRGDNGGDALLAAAALARHGVSVDAVRTAPLAHERALHEAKHAGVGVHDVDGGVEDIIEAPSYDLVVDGIVGIGVHGDPALHGGARDAVAGLMPLVWERQAPPIVAVDIPSGLHPDTGLVADEWVLPATVTVTFGAVKAGLAQHEGVRLAGRIVLVELGLDLAGVVPAGTAEVEIYAP